MYFLYSVYLIRIIRTLLYHLAWWEIKEYRLDRMMVHLRETIQGRRWILSPGVFVKWALLIVYSVFPRVFSPSGWTVALSIVYAVEALRYVFELKRGWKMPGLRVRVLAIYVVALSMIGWVIFNPKNSLIFSLLFIDALLGIGTGLLILFSNTLFSLHKSVTMYRARKKIARYPNLTVIGVTGSYGKTTTKELIAQILSHQFTVVKTVASQNADIGVAERIVSQDLEGVDFFICEMAAYHPGEITSTCSLFGDNIIGAVVTGIDEQHQSLFGSMDTTRDSKYELIDAVKPGGFALFNKHSEKIHPMPAWAKEQGFRVVMCDTHVATPFHYKPLPSYLEQDLALAITASQLAGMQKKDIAKAVSSLVLPSKTMDEARDGNVTLINDTFNANPDAVYAALSYIRSFKGKKVLVLQPLIELGSYADDVHENMGKMAASICDEIVLTNENFNAAFFRGVFRSNHPDVAVRIGKAPSRISSGVVLFEGKEAEKYIYSLK